MEPTKSPHNTQQIPPQDDDQTPPEHFMNFPFQPYDIQVELMKVAYDSFENSKFALLESPTGTGKSLSLICSMLTWLKDHQKSTKSQLQHKQTNLRQKIELLKRDEETSGDWLSIQTRRQDVNRDLVEVTKRLDEIVKLELRSDARRQAKLLEKPFDEFPALNEKAIVNDGRTNIKKENSENIYLAKEEVFASQSSVGEPEEEDIEKKISLEDNLVKPKIFYASRTHSQLSQFVHEIKKTKFSSNKSAPPIKLTSLASRANLCVNAEVLKLKDPNAINERCTEMQRETNKDKKCPYIKYKHVNQMKDEILSQVQDIEDLVALGKVIGGCPYYASRVAIPEAEVVILPYNNLLHHETRKASALDLKDSVVVVDESHNILETICSIHSAPISGIQLILSHAILSRYFNKYCRRMSPKNAEIIKMVVQCLCALLQYLDNPHRSIKDFDTPKAVSLNDSIASLGSPEKATGRSEEIMLEVDKFIAVANIGKFNAFRILDYFNRSQLARKLLGFNRQGILVDLTMDLIKGQVGQETPNGCRVEPDESLKKPVKKRKYTKKQNPKQEKPINDKDCTNLNFLKANNANIDKIDTSSLSYPIYALLEFLKSLTNISKDGKILTNHIRGDVARSSMKFILLNPSAQFKQTTEQARSIVLAGGTMQPFSEFVDLLFGPLGVDSKRLTVFSCNHVVSSKHLFVASLSNGLTNKPLELSFKTKSSLDAIDEIGKTIMSISQVAPCGMVCFFPSYDYEQLCFNRWTYIGVIRNIEIKSKQVFREPKQAAQVKVVLEEYARTIEKGVGKNRGAMLMCVVGGKMSEGINFNDDLGRCVVMVGLPYANIKSVELQQKMLHYDRTVERRAGQVMSPGQSYYENLCIKGVNQSIGRAIRHKQDYAAIILLDRRYTSKASVRSGLAGWMRPSLKDYDRFGPLMSGLRAFFECMAAARERGGSSLETNKQNNK